jgi:EAL and modified HD-GYP domain-containing signal transduction protein
VEILFARQPIYDRNLRVIGYELLYRSVIDLNENLEADGDIATASVLIGAFLNCGIENITNRKLGFINFADNLLKSDIIKLLPNKHLVIEILETIDPSDEILDICGQLKKLGFTIALDDFVHNESTEKLVKYAKILKMDFLTSTNRQLHEIVQKYKKKGKKFLAEKIETREQFDKAKAYGYDYFQGYYFSKPVLIHRKVLMPLQSNALQVLGLLQDDDCDVRKVAQILNYDPGMTHKLFMLANSVAYGGRHRIRNISHALMRVGLKELRTWILFILMHGMHQDKADELIRQSIIRARIAEDICATKNLDADTSCFSLLGLFSLLDAIMDVPFRTIFLSVKIPEHIEAALLNPGDDIYGCVVQLLSAYDRGDWAAAEEAGGHIKLSLKEYGAIYFNAIQWCDSRYKSFRFRG